MYIFGNAVTQCRVFIAAIVVAHLLSSFAVNALYFDGDGFTNYPSCDRQSESKLEDILKCIDCLKETGCPRGCCNSVLTSGQYLICKTPGCCARVIQTTSADGEIIATLEQISVPDLPGQIVCPNSSLQHDADAAQCGPICALKINGDSYVNCPSGISVPDASNLEFPRTCLVPGAKKSSSSEHTDAPSNDTEPSKKSISSDCFPGHASVLLDTGSRVPMSDLQIGDRVLVSEANEFSPVFMFTHRDPHASSHHMLAVKVAQNMVASNRTCNSVSNPQNYLESYSRPQELVLTRGHLVHVAPDMRLVEASALRPGQDSIMLADTGEFAQVVSVSSIPLGAARGLYNPQTVHGDIVVDNVVCSTLTNAFSSPWLAHAAMTPCRILFQQLGLSCSFLEGQSGFGETVRHSWIRLLASNPSP